MVSTSWLEWLTTLSSIQPQHPRRRLRTSTGSRVEFLEDRALLAVAPVVVDGIVSPQEDQPFPGSVATLGSDDDLDTLTFSVVTQPSHGTLTFASSGAYTYTPALNYNGDDFFTFMANDGTLESNVGTVSLVITPVNDPLKLTLPSAALQVNRTTTPVRLDPAASVNDVDTVVNYGKTQVRTTIYTGNSATDIEKSRVVLKVRSETPGPGAVNVIGSKIFVNGSGTAIASFSGGNQGRSLIINFTSVATQDDVNLVIKQISFQASKKATLGIRSLQMTVTAGNQRTSAAKIVTVVPS